MGVVRGSLLRPLKMGNRSRGERQREREGGGMGQLI